MNHNMTFGKCLKFLLSTLNLSMQQLGKSINVDSSLISRWVNEKRIPSYTYLHRLSEYLSKYCVSPMHDNFIKTLYESFKEKTPPTAKTNQEMIYYILYYSLNNTVIRQNEILKEKNTYELNQSFKNTVNLSKEDKIVYGSESIYHILLTLLNQAELDTQNHEKQIYLTCYNNYNLLFLSKNRLQTLQEKFLKVLQKEWNLTILFRFDETIDIVIKFITFTLPLIKTGRVQLHYITTNDSSMIRNDLFIISGVGALSCYPMKDLFHNICAFFLTNIASIEILSNYTDLLKENTAKKIINYYKEERNALYFTALTSIENKNGAHYSYNDCFHTLLLHPKLYDKLIAQTGITKEEQALSNSYYQKRYEGLSRALTHYTFMEIYFLSKLDTLCKEKVLILPTTTGNKIVSLEIQDILDYLKHVKNLIKTYPNYQIAMLFNDDETLLTNITFLIKERQFVFFDIFDDREESTVRLSMDDPIMVHAFVNYYKSIWDNISPLNKDKNDILSVIDDYIQELERNERV